jgi:prepilin-type N-terminal cleavage/methylation domain-containing protein
MKYEGKNMNAQPSIPKRICGQEGFTLVEALVAIVIFAIGIIGCYTMQMNSIGSSIQANTMTTSSTWATYAIENLLALEYDNNLLKNSSGNAVDGRVDLDDTNKAGDTPDGYWQVRKAGKVEQAADADALYTIYWNVVDDYPLTNTKQIRVNVVRNVGANSSVVYSHDYFKTNENL